MNTFSSAGLPHPLSSASSSSASPYAVKGSSLASLFLAAVIPLVFLKVIAFFSHTWPNFVYRLLTSRLNRQIATIEERVYPNRLIQDDIMIRSIMGYVSYCYLQTLRTGADACDAVNMADYEYTFIYENIEDFDEDWVPFSTAYTSLFGRVIASAMELSVLPSTGQAIQVEPGLFVRSLENKHVHGRKDHESEVSEGEESSEASRKAQKGGRDSTNLNHMDRLNQYAFYDMRKYAENMDEHAEPPADGNADDADSVERPFDAPAQNRRARRDKKRQGGAGDAKADSTCFDDNENPRQENFLVLEYRRPLSFERSRALCTSQTTAGVATTFDETRPAGDVIEGFLDRAHGWYLGHVAQRKTSPLMAIYPSPTLALFTAQGIKAMKPRDADEGDFSGRCYVLESASPAAAATTAAATATRDAAGNASGSGDGADAGIAAAITIGPSTISGGHIGLDGAAHTVRSMGKTFASLFFPSKPRVLSVIDDFVQERGRYGVPGVVARLNFFLHGAPGTGKTSFVKALARYLHRHLVVVSMSEIVTVDELQRLLQPFQLNHGKESENGYGDPAENHFSVRPHQCIYVFEDFDAIGDAWAALKRDQCARKVVEAQQKKERKAAVSSSSSAEDVDDHENKEGCDEEEASEHSDADESGEESGGVKKVEGDAARVTALGPATDASSKSTDVDASHRDADDDDEDDGEDSDASSESEAAEFLLEEEKLEELERTHLTVEKFLDLFNGFNLPDSFIAVFTTNHPERVHPLITSSNMMDVALDMGMLSDECATEMVEHYFASELADSTPGAKARRHLTAEQTADLHAALSVFNSASDGLSGALLEKMCIECDTIELLTQRLRAADTWEVMNAF